jgi:TetR/AcrR family transcriptional regulator, fatty acid metabolism regulator protein
MRTKEGNKERDILQAAIAVFAKEGYANAKMHHIADGSGVAIGTVYLYFRNKEKILLHIFETVWRDLYERIREVRERTDLDPQAKVEGVIDAVFGYFEPVPQLALVFVNELPNIIRTNRRASFIPWYEKTLGQGESLITDGRKNGCFNPEVSPSFFRHMLLGGMRHLLYQWASDQRSFPLPELRRNFKTIMLFGIVKKG